MTPDSLNNLRSAIEEVDSAIITLIAERLALAFAIGQLKVKNGQAITDAPREAAVVANAARMARAAGLPEEDIRALYWQIVALARNAQIREHSLSSQADPVRVSQPNSSAALAATIPAFGNANATPRAKPPTDAFAPHDALE